MSGDVKAIKNETVDQMVTNYIFGGMNIILGVATDISQIGNIVVAKGNSANLAAAINTISISE